MKKRILSIVIAAALFAALGGTAQAAGVAQPPEQTGSLSHFTLKRTYTSGQFTDVEPWAWYAMYIQADYEYGLLGGRHDAVFAPSAPVTAAEAVKLAACLHSIYHTGKTISPGAVSWVKPYADYALKNGIIDPLPADDGAPVTRAQFALMISKALPAGVFTAINSVEDNAIPDVAMTDSFSGAVYTLYRAGVLNGCDPYGTFHPFGTLSRAEAAAIVARAANTEFRRLITLPSVLSGEELYEKCADAVFLLERYNAEGDLIGIGSGFFITRDGLAVTNFHVIDGASSAVITTSDGSRYDVAGVNGYDKTTDLAILQIDGSGFSYLPLGDSDRLEIGAFVYAIGSPLKLVNTISEGIVSSLNRQIDGGTYIQYTAPISMGSGGGPVLNTLGQVVGITCLTVRSGQTLNFAVPVNFVGALSRTDCKPLAYILLSSEEQLAFYKNYYPVPDYGVFTGTPLFKEQYDEPTDVKTYFYLESDITVEETVAIYGYTRVLSSFGFKWQSSYYNDLGYAVDVYYNGDLDMSVHFGQDKLDGAVCRFVAIH